VDDYKKAGREIETEAKKQVRDLDGHDLGDDIGNAGDEIRKHLGNAGDEIREGLDRADQERHERSGDWSRR
jgi:hypothetical protein